MRNMLTIKQAESADDIEQVRVIFREYEAWLGLDLCFQGFEAELAGLPGKYALPTGRLYLAYVEDRLAGCIAMRDLGGGVCEMKRLFVRDSFRGEGIGVRLIERLVEDAGESGYSAMRLDTFPPKMRKAVELYESHGFVPIPPYYENPHGDVLFMEKRLR